MPTKPNKTFTTIIYFQLDTLWFKHIIAQIFLQEAAIKNHIDNQVEYWDQVASEKKFTHPLDKERLYSLVKKDAKILNFGCGYGRLCNELVSLGYTDVQGVDSSEKMIARGLEENPDLRLSVIDPEKISFDDNSFDAVVLFSVLTCIPTNEGQRSLVKEINRILRPGGVLYISDILIQDDERNKKRYQEFENQYGIFGVFQLSEGAICRHLDLNWMEELLKDFNKINLSAIDIVTMNGNPSKGFQFFGCKGKYKTT